MPDYKIMVLPKLKGLTDAKVNNDYNNEINFLAEKKMILCQTARFPFTPMFSKDYFPKRINPFFHMLILSSSNSAANKDIS